MKSTLLLLALVPTFLFSQITVTSADHAFANDTVRTSLATDPGIDFTTTGANQTWDFSSLTADSQELTDYIDLSGASILVNLVYGAFAPSKYQASYSLPSLGLPLDQIGPLLPVNISDVRAYSRKTTDSITSVGLALAVDGNEIPFKSDTIETRYKFPTNFGDTYSSRGYTEMDLNPATNAILLQYRQRFTEVDGWGSLTTPFGTYSTLRLKHSITEIDSIMIEIFSNPTWVELPIPDSYIYEWWATGEKEPLLKISTSIVGGTETVTEIRYREDYLGLDLGFEELGLNFEIFPNPTVDVLTINGIQENLTYVVVDGSGKTVLTGITTKSIDVSMLENGTYQLILISNNVFGSKTFIKQ